MTFDDDTSRNNRPGHARKPHQPSPLGGRYFADLLRNVENEPVPERLLDLAHRLEKALAERHDKSENSGPDKG